MKAFKAAENTQILNIFITKEIPETMFRYIPDHDTIQRLCMRFRNMKDEG